MKKIFNFIAFILVLSSCNQSKPRIGIVEEKDLTQTQIDSILNEYNFIYDDLTFIDSTNQVLFPITTQKSYNRKRYSSSEYEVENYPRYWNILFYNNISNKTSLLTNSKVRISDFRCNIKNSGPILKDRILYKIGDTDYNKDKKYNFKDPLHLFVSNIDGSQLTRLSPLNENLQTYQIVPNTDKIIFRTIRDIDSDFDFDNEDELIWYQVDLSITNSLKEIIKTTDRKLIEKLYFEQWLVKK
ncbi:hypothetical protein D1818_19505 [Aquimarina sp. BL5]|uniref:hypothetical protein n=1 Tax=Aquimarina sp. BL5 TaxID=1714860 RepID=UPI000E486AEC|nr:hypothetical protein [Aquimarina sp. BL5]AXT52900.1 hypothetical protein D1818_19505 [Aquimarina sp. BL5]RKN02283.1 hypothetical protein D7036_16710 [Aquimarina sp. BL5]